MLCFRLGTHYPGWLWRLTVPLFVSDRQLRRYRTLQATTAPWALDSGAFSELQLHGSWDRVPAADYIARARRYQQQVGNLDWIAQQDWPCESWVRAGGTGPRGARFVGTGAGVREHQQRTIGTAQTKLTDPETTLKVVSTKLRFTDTEHKGIWEHFLTVGDRSAGGIMHAVTSYAQVLADNGDIDRGNEFNALGVAAVNLTATHA